MTRLNLLRFPLMVMVAYIHAYGTTVTMHGQVLGIESLPPIYQDIEDIISQGIARIAVPLFYFISGYLFFRTATFSLDSYRDKIASRVWTLLVPYLFWNILLFLIIYFAQSAPALASFFSDRVAPLSSLSLTEQLDLILGVTPYPIAYQFWFIRDLMVLVLLSPLIYPAARYAGPYTSVILFFVWLLNPWPIAVAGIEPLFFFFLGAYFGVARIPPFSLDRFGPAIIAIYLGFLVLSLVLAGLAMDNVALKLAILVGVPVALYLSKIAAANPRVEKVLLTLAPAAFFVFATHEPLITILKKLAYRYMMMTPPLALTIYFTLPLLVVVFTTAVYFLLARIAPGVLQLAIGQRRYGAVEARG